MNNSIYYRPQDEQGQEQESCRQSYSRTRRESLETPTADSGGALMGTATCAGALKPSSASGNPSSGAIGDKTNPRASGSGDGTKGWYAAAAEAAV